MKSACLLAFTLAAIVSCAGPLKQTEIPVLDSYAATDRWVTDHIAYVPDIVPWWKIDDWRPAAEIIARGYGDCDDLTMAWDAIIERNFGVPAYFCVGIKFDHGEALFHAYGEADGHVFNEKEDFKFLIKYPYRQAEEMAGWLLLDRKDVE